MVAGATIRSVNSSVEVCVEMPKKIGADVESMVLQSQRSSDPGCQACVKRQSVLADECIGCVTWVRLRKAGHDHSSVQATGQRDSSRSLRLDVSRQDSLKGFLEFGFVRLDRK